MASSDAEVVAHVQRTVAEALERNRLRAPDQRFVVAVSGGADSLCLLDALVKVVSNWNLVVGHVDHRLRVTSAEDARHVEALASRYGVTCKVITVDVPALAQAERRGIEEAARLGRYRALRDRAHANLGNPVATGHTRDDQVETVLMHLLRGSGTNGLRGMREYERLDTQALGEDGPPDIIRGIDVVRPLLDVTREDTQRYCEARNIPYRVDETNADPRFLRNRIRHHLLPVLRTYNDGVDRALTRLSRLMQDDDEYLEHLSSQRWSRLVRQPGSPLFREYGDPYTVELAGWRRTRAAVQRRLVRQIARKLGHDEIGFDAVERALAVGSDDGPPRAELGGGMIVERRADTLYFSRNQRNRDD